VSLFDIVNRKLFNRRTNERRGPMSLGETSGATFSWSLSPRRTTTPESFPRFRSSASDQLNPTVSDRFAAMRLKLRRAFTPAQPIVDRRMFAGRTELIRALIDAIEDQRLHAVIYGDRGIGKTSTLHVLAEAAREARYLVIYVSCSSSTSFDEFFQAVAHEIPLLYLSNYGPTSQQAERGAKLEELITQTPVSVRAASQFCAKVAGTRVLILLDEFDRTASAAFRRQIADFVKNLSDQSARVQLLIAGVAANLTEILAEIPSIQRNILALEVPKMTPAELRELVLHGQNVSGLTFEGDAVEVLVAAADGYPYLASLLGQHAGLAALQEERASVSVRDVSAAISVALGELRARMSRRAQSQIAALSRDGVYKVLGRLAALAKLSNGVFSEADIDAAHPSPELAARCRAVLEKLASDGRLVERFEDEFGLQYRFLEADVPQYLWLMTTQSRLATGEPVRATALNERARH
jgi:Cdc6-like AAA superfamily ATPase